MGAAVAKLERGMPGYGISLMDEYIHDVHSGALLSNKYARYAVERHLRDLKNGSKRGLFFNREAAEFAINFILLLRHTTGEWKGMPFNLQPFQAFIVGSIFGWMQHIEIDNKPRVKRRFKKAYTEVSRKNGKTELATGIGILMCFFDGEGSAEVYTVANKKDQAKICWDKAESMMRMLIADSKSVANMIQISKKSIFSLKLGSKMVPLAADAKTEDGSNPYCAILDEYHEAVTSDMLEVQETGMGGRVSPLLFVITTAGTYKQTKPCVILRKVVTDILEGSKEDDSMFGIIFTLDSEEEWTNPEMWIKANPNIGKSPYWHNMMADFKMAQNEGGTKESNFKTKNLNIWVKADKTWMPDTFYKKCAGSFSYRDFPNATAYGAIDLASKYDITTFRMMIPHEGKFYFTGFFYLPEDVIDERGQIGQAYKRWADAGYIKLTPGNTIDQDFIIHDIAEVSKTLNFRRIDYDTWNASQVAVKLTEMGHDMNIHPQTIQYLGPATKEYERLMRCGDLVHDNNPVQQWMLSNVVLWVDPNGNYKPDKKRSAEKIDGIIADIMAVSGYTIASQVPESIYKTQGIRSL